MESDDGKGGARGDPKRGEDLGVDRVDVGGEKRGDVGEQGEHAVQRVAHPEAIAQLVRGNLAASGKRPGAVQRLAVK